MPLQPDVPRFLQVANHPALDFINTVNGRPEWTVDYLTSPAHVGAWAEQRGMATHTARRRMERDATAEDFDSLIELRELLYRTFSNTCAGHVPPNRDLQTLFNTQSDGFRHADLTIHNGHLEPSWAEVSLRTIRYKISTEAVQLLQAGDLSRTRACLGCGWLFLDTSRGSARRWCSMDLCGTKDKMRRYRAIR